MFSMWIMAVYISPKWGYRSILQDVPIAQEQRKILPHFASSGLQSVKIDIVESWLTIRNNEFIS